MNIKCVLFSRTTLALSACAAAGPKMPNRAAVVMKLNDNEAYVCMGMGEVKPGDRVEFFKTECTRQYATFKNATSPLPSCKKTKLGEGIVTKSLNEHYSTIEVDPGGKFEEGTMVEKL